MKDCNRTPQILYIFKSNYQRFTYYLSFGMHFIACDAHIALVEMKP